MAEPILDIRDLSVSYAAERWAIKGFHLTIGASESVGLMGASGCGKSTVAWAILGLLPAYAKVTGSIRVCGNAVNAGMRGPTVALVPQEPASALNPVLTLGRQVRDVAGGQTIQAAKGMLARLGLPLEIYDAYPHQVSGGQLQRVALGQALLCKPKLLVADEPAAALDRGTRTEVMQLVKDLQRELGFGLLLITHEPEMAQHFADRVMDISLPSESSPAPTRAHLANADWVLRARGVSKSYARVRALDGVDLELKAGGRLVITGESGSGKSTLAKCLAGWETADNGTVEFKGAKKPQLIPQEPGESLNPFWEAWEVVTESLRLEGVGETQRREKAIEWIERVGLPAEVARRKSGTCSGGERARLAIARALVMCECEQRFPGVFIFDESFSGLQLGLRRQILDLLDELQARWPLTYIVIAHDEWLTRTFADSVAVMREGRLSG